MAVFQTIFELPNIILQGLNTGEYIRFGGVIRDAKTKHIVAMLREVGPAMPEASTLFTQFGSVASFCNLGVSVLNLGVSIVGFSLILKRLKEIEKCLKKDLDIIQESINHLHHKFDISVCAVIKINPAYNNAYFKLGNVHAALNEYDKAIADYTQFIKIEPICADAYYMRGCVKSKKGDRRGALADLNEVINIDSEYADAYSKRGYIYKEKGNKEEAIKEFEVAIVILSKKGKLDKVKILQNEIFKIEKEIQSTPWWQKRIF